MALGWSFLISIFKFKLFILIIILARKNFLVKKRPSNKKTPARINPAGILNFIKENLLFYFLLTTLAISPNTSGIRERARTGSHSHVKDTTSKSSLKTGTYITTKSRAKDRITAFIR